MWIGGCPTKTFCRRETLILNVKKNLPVMFENEKIPFILVDFTILATETVVPFHAPGVDVGEQVEDLEVG